MATLATRAWVSLVALAIVMGAILFIPAGTVIYWQAWLYLAVFFGASVFTTHDLAKRDPALLERRMRGGPTAERESRQRVIMVLASLCFVALLVVPALDHRFRWSVAPLSVVLAGNVLALGSYYGLLAFVAMVPVLIWRLVDEERLLARTLPGYREYQGRVSYRLVPRVW